MQNITENEQRNFVMEKLSYLTGAINGISKKYFQVMSFLIINLLICQAILYTQESIVLSIVSFIVMSVPCLLSYFFYDNLKSVSEIPEKIMNFKDVGKFYNHFKNAAKKESKRKRAIFGNILMLLYVLKEAGDEGLEMFSNFKGLIFTISPIGIILSLILVISAFLFCFTNLLLFIFLI